MKADLATTSSRKNRVFEKARKALEGRPTPALVMDSELVREDFNAFRGCFPTAGLFYALKANSDPQVASLFCELGSGFEVGSEGTLRLVLDLGVPASKIISGNPLKTPEFVRHAYDVGVRKFTFDSLAEVDKMAELAPGSEVCVRIAVSNNYSEWPLDKKFGIEEDKAAGMLCAARSAGLVPTGIAFHPGSQCVDTAGWAEGLKQCKRVWDQAAAMGIKLTSLNLGGGFPSEYTRPVPRLDQIARVIERNMRELFPESPELLLEPGRGLVGEAGVMVTTVIARASREGQEWIYLDAGVFNGLMESVGGISYPLRTTKEAEIKNYTVAGPSCDSMDVLPGLFQLPNLEIGDRVYIMSAGAYTTAYASHFDGIPIPRVILV